MALAASRHCYCKAQGAALLEMLKRLVEASGQKRVYRLMTACLLEREIMRVGFVIKAHGNSSWRAAVGCRISGSEVRDMKLLCPKALHNYASATIEIDAALRPPLRMAVYNGGLHSQDTRDLVDQLNLVFCFTRARSQRHGEAFVQTFKRDYLRVNPLPGPATVLQKIGEQFEDYNEIHRQSGLGMHSPRELILANQPTVHQDNEGTKIGSTCSP